MQEGSQTIRCGKAARLSGAGMLLLHWVARLSGAGMLLLHWLARLSGAGMLLLHWLARLSGAGRQPDYQVWEGSQTIRCRYAATPLGS